LSEDLLALPAPSRLRIPYGSEPSQFGELRLPGGSGPHPVVILLHGGYWRARYDLAYMSHAAAALTDAGCATWNVEYRRLGEPGGGWPGTFLDVACAADSLRVLAPEHHLDRSRVVALGHSAGGQLALWLAGRSSIVSDSPLAAPEPLSLLGVVALAPVADLIRARELGLSDAAVAEFLGGDPQLHPDRYAAASPIELLPLGIPQVLIHGEADEDVPIELSERYIGAAQAAGEDAQLLRLPGTGHFEVVDPRAGQWLTVIQALRCLVALETP
jgi:acetyl esterase/lipase